MIKDFQIISKLGEGAYSAVYKVKRLSDGKEYALKRVKLLNLNDKEKDNAQNEIRILASIRQPNIICYKEAFWERNSSSLCIIMELSDDGDLFQKVCAHKKKGVYIDEKEIWNMLTQMFKGIKALHDLNIFHRDLKSANVFLNKDGFVKIGDMNVSKVAKKGLLYTQTGTPYYASPEVWMDKPYDSKSDIWSVGCVIYEMATLRPPFRAEDMDGLYKKIIKGVYPKLPSHFSVDLNNLIKLLLQVRPNQRPSAEKLLSMPFMVKRMESNFMLENDENLNVQLLQTILVPKDFHYLTDKLPIANYEPIKTRISNKLDYIQKSAMTDPDQSVEGSYDKNSQKKLPGILQGIQGSSQNNSNVQNRIGSGINSSSKANKNHLASAQNAISNISRSPQSNLMRDKEIYKKQNYKLESHLKKYNEILNNNKHIQKNKAISGKQNEILNDYMKIYGVGLGNNSSQSSGVKNKYSSNNLKMKLEPIKNPAQNLPKLISNNRDSKDKSQDRGHRLPKLG